MEGLAGRSKPSTLGRILWASFKIPEGKVGNIMRGRRYNLREGLQGVSEARRRFPAA
jgi:hypothetical protein